MALKIQFAPWRLPLERRLQTLGVCYYMYCILFRLFFIIPLFIYLLNTRYYYLVIFYFVWYIYDYNTPFQGGRPSKFFRWLLGSYAPGYFPIKLIKTAELPADRNYIFACHPHGIWSFSHAATFCSEGIGFRELFPGLQINMVTLKMFFMIPIHREFVMMTGCCVASRDSIDYIMNQKENSGRGVAIVVGGAREVRETRAKTMKLTLKNRKGFVRMALRHGACLVPVISFGENDVYEIFPEKPSEFYLKMQNAIYGLFGVLPPIFYGRGIFQYNFGLLPKRKPITVIIGQPIDVKKDPSPSEIDVDRLHSVYIEKFTELYMKHRDAYGYSDVQLELI